MGPQDRDGDAAAPRQIGLIPLIIFWCVVMGLLYAGMSVYLQPKKAQVLANGDLIIPRALDGHFYTPGRIQGVEVTFLVDTGASLVTIRRALRPFSSRSHMAPPNRRKPAGLITSPKTSVIGSADGRPSYQKPHSSAVRNWRTLSGTEL